VEQKDLLRALLATVVALSFIVLWNTYIFPPPPPPGPVPKPVVQPGPEPAPARAAAPPSAAAPKIREPAPRGPVAPPRQARQVRKVEVETPLVRIGFSNEGARVENWWLKGYRGGGAGATDMVSARFRKADQLPLDFALKDRQLEQGLQRALFEVEPAAGLRLTEANPEGSLRFVFSDGRGLSAEKRIHFRADRYQVEVEARVARYGRPLEVALQLGPDLGNPRPGERKAQGLTAARAVYVGGDGSLKQVEADQVEAKPWRIRGPLVWAGLQDKYFLAAAYGWSQAGAAPLPWVRLEPAAAPAQQAALRIAIPLAPDRSLPLFLGPKDYELLGKLPVDLRSSIEFGWFGWLAVPLLYALKFLHSYVHNYGVAIILITIALRVVFYPLNKIQIDSSKKMSALQPKMNAIRERYRKHKGDIKKQQEMNQELQELFRKEGVNPLGGCLPMLAQFPVFIAFYNLLNNAIELRGQPFLYLSDLSAKDPTLVLPLLMGASWFLQMRMMPANPGTNPAQQKMMQLMPLIFTVMFLEMPSGLILYWFVTNLLAIAQQRLMLGPGSGAAPKPKRIKA